MMYLKDSLFPLDLYIMKEAKVAEKKIYSKGTVPHFVESVG